MKIGIFIMKAGSQAGGLATYEQQLVRELAAIDKKNDYHVLGFSPQTLDSLEIDQENFHMHAVRPHNKWIGMTLTVPNAMKRLGLPMVHGAFAIPWRMPCPYAFTVHDYYMFSHPQFLPTLLRIRLQRMYRRAFSEAGKLIVISEFVRDMVARNFDVPEDRMEVVYNGCSDIMQPGDPDESCERLSRLYGINDPFFLFTGRLEPRKNMVRMLR
jgi:glycosyltransferase involved in cell wall biosynthesis